MIYSRVEDGSRSLPPSMLCSTCASLLQLQKRELSSGLQSQENAIIHHELESLQSSADFGCSLCKAMLNRLPVDVLDSLRGRNSVLNAHLKYYPLQSSHSSLSFWFSDKTKPELALMGQGLHTPILTSHYHLRLATMDG